MEKIWDGIEIGIGKWKDVEGLIIILIIEAIVFSRYFHAISSLNFYYLQWWFLPVAFFITIFVWSLITVRLYIREGWLLLACMLAAGVLSVANYYMLPMLLPRITQNTLFFVSIGMLVLTVSLILFLMTKKISRGKVLLVFFLKNKVSPKVAKSLNALIKSSVENIENRYENVKIVVPPIGMFGNRKKCYRYIANPLTRGDVYVMAEVFDEDDESTTNFVFTQFYSQVNKHIDYCKYIVPGLLLDRVNSTLKESNWQYKQDDQNNLARKIRMSNNIESLLMLYVCSTLMIKNKFSDAISFVQKVRASENFSDINFRNLSDILLGDSYLLASQNEEHVCHDYGVAYNHLNTFADQFPSQKNSPMYIHAMARVLFYRNNINESKRYTRMLRNLKGDTYKWGYELNMGFYSICEGKISEFVQHYKNLKKYDSYGRQQIQFTIKFLKDELKNTIDTDKKVLLNYAIAYLYQYFGIKKARALISQTNLIYVSNPNIEKLIKLREIILQSKKNWPIGTTKK